MKVKSSEWYFFVTNNVSDYELEKNSVHQKQDEWW